MSKKESVTEMTVRLAGKQTPKDKNGKDINKETLYSFYRQGGHRHEAGAKN